MTLCGGGTEETNRANCKLCPKTVEVLKSIPCAWDLGNNGGGECIFSGLKQGTHLKPHCGSSNMRLTCHLGLFVPKGWKLRCGSETRSWEVESLFGVHVVSLSNIVCNTCTHSLTHTQRRESVYFSTTALSMKSCTHLLPVMALQARVLESCY